MESEDGENNHPRSRRCRSEASRNPMGYVTISAPLAVTSLYKISV